MASAPDRLLLTPVEAARLCGVSRATIDQWSHRTGFPVIRQGRIVRIELELFKLWLQSEARRTNAAELAEVTPLPMLVPPARRRR